MKSLSSVIGLIATTALAGITILSTPAFADTDPQTEIAALKAEVQKENAIIQKLMAKVNQLQAQQNQQASKVDNLQKQQTTTEAKAPSKAESVEQAGIHNWSGPYAGVSVGAGMASGEIDDRDFQEKSDSFGDGVVQGGVHVGYNRQISNTVLGIEGEANLGSQDHKGYGTGRK